jgi:hypothetical protein
MCPMGHILVAVHGTHLGRRETGQRLKAQDVRSVRGRPGCCVQPVSQGVWDATAAHINTLDKRHVTNCPPDTNSEKSVP